MSYLYLVHGRCQDLDHRRGRKSPGRLQRSIRQGPQACFYLGDTDPDRGRQERHLSRAPEEHRAAGSNDTVKNFLATLAENNRLGLLKGICDKFRELISASRGEVEIVITSAQVRYLPYIYYMPT